MKNRHFMTVTFAALVIIVVASRPSLGASIGFNFVGALGPGPGPEVAAEEVAGVVPQSNWNNGDGMSGAVLNVVDDSGGPTTADVTWTSQTTWGGQAAGTTGDQHLMGGWIDDSFFLTMTAGADVTVSQIPYDVFDLYIYVTSDFGNETRRSRHEVNGEEVVSESRWQNLGPEGTFFTGTHIDGSTALSDHSFVVVRNLTGETLTILGQRMDIFPGGTVRGNVNGFQIVQVPEPASLALAVLALCNLAVFRHRRRSA